MNPKQKTMAALLSSSPYGAGVARQVDEYFAISRVPMCPTPECEGVRSELDPITGEWGDVCCMEVNA